MMPVPGALFLLLMLRGPSSFFCLCRGLVPLDAQRLDEFMITSKSILSIQFVWCNSALSSFSIGGLTILRFPPSLLSISSWLKPEMEE
jgi:hypothetical protein